MVVFPWPYKVLPVASTIKPLQLKVPGASSTIFPLVRYLFIVFWSFEPIQVAVASAFQVLLELEAAIITEAAWTGYLLTSIEKKSADKVNKVNNFLKFDLIIPASPNSLIKGLYRVYP
jgi:hypothetical protein